MSISLIILLHPAGTVRCELPALHRCAVKPVSKALPQTVQIHVPYIITEFVYSITDFSEPVRLNINSALSVTQIWKTSHSIFGENHIFETKMAPSYQPRQTILYSRWLFHYSTYEKSTEQNQTFVLYFL